MKRTSRQITETLSTGAIAFGLTKELEMGERSNHRMERPDGKGVARREVDRLNTGETNTELHDMGKEWPRKQKNTGGGVAEKADGKHPGEMKEQFTAEDVANYMEDNGGNLQELFDRYADTTNCVTLREFAEYTQAYGMTISSEQMFCNLLEANNKYLFQEAQDNDGRYWIPTIVETNDNDDDGGGDSGNDTAVFCKKCYTKHAPSAGCKGQKENAQRNGQSLTEARDFEIEEPEAHHAKLSAGLAPEHTEADHLAGTDDLPGGEDLPSEGDLPGPEGADEDGEGEVGGIDDGDGRFAGCPECGGHLDEYGACEECGYSEGGESTGMGAEFGLDMPPEQGGMSGAPLEDEFGFDQQGGEFMDPPTSPVGHKRRYQAHHRHYDDMDESTIIGGLTGRPITEEGTPTYKTHEGAPADHGGHEMDSPDGGALSDKKAKKHPRLPQEPIDTKEIGKEWPRKQKNTGGALQADHESTHGEPVDGFTTKVADLNLKTKQKNTGQQHEEFEAGGYGEAEMKVGGGPRGGGGSLGGGAKKMHENVERLSRHITRLLKQHMNESGKFKQRGSYPVNWVIGAGQWVRPKQCASLTEAAADAEELLQIFGPNHVTMEARITDQHGTTIMRKLIPLLQVANRGPIVAENRLLFRYPELARDFADVLVKEGKTCSALSHNWGAAVAARISYKTAAATFDAIREESTL